jgi:hypothetical protein
MGLRFAPDIIIHIPYERGLTERRDEGNFVAIELKRHANEADAQKAFANLSRMKEVLEYPLTVFINIDSEETYAAACPKNIAGQTICFAVHRVGGKSVVRSHKCDHPVKGKQRDD